jgi:hypothetical protein
MKAIKSFPQKIEIIVPSKKARKDLKVIYLKRLNDFTM